jgi:hypothetical protein
MTSASELRFELRRLGPVARAELARLARDDPAGFYRALAQRPDLAGLTHRLAQADSPEIARLRVLRGIRDVTDEA